MVALVIKILPTDASSPFVNAFTYFARCESLTLFKVVAEVATKQPLTVPFIFAALRAIYRLHRASCVGMHLNFLSFKMSATSKRAKYPSMLTLGLEMVLEILVNDVLFVTFREGAVERT